MNDEEFQRALHVRGPIPTINGVDIDYTPPKWTVCNDEVESHMSHDKPISMLPTVSKLLDQYQMLFYNGNHDLNWCVW